MRISGRKPSFRTRQWAQQQRIVLLTLIGVNIAVFFAQFSIEASQPGIFREYLGISDRGVHDAYAWQFLTAMFLHTGPWHLLANMLVLFLLGRDIESILGQRHFFYLYLSGAIGGELGHLFLMPSHAVLAAGSGGVAAVIIAYATILPELELSGLALPLVPLRLKAKWLACGVVGSAVVLICLNRTGTVGHSALLGGCAAGWLYMHLLGFGRTSFLRRLINRRRVEAQRYQRMSVDQLVSGEIDPLLEKISRSGFQSLTRAERRSLTKAREQILEKENVR